MPHEVIYDASGEPMELLRTASGRLASVACNEETLNKMTSVQLRPDDILLCSYPKSGSHWLWETVRSLRDGELYMDHEEKLWMDRTSVADLNNLPSPRLMCNSCFFEDQPRDVLLGQVKVILLYRNPKDIATSFFYHHSRIPTYGYAGEFTNYLGRFLEGKVDNGCVFDYWRSWQQGLLCNPQLPCLVLSYEDLHQNPIYERHRIAAFLGRQYSDNFICSLIDNTNIDNMRQLKQRTSLKDKTGATVMYRKGEVGDWKDHFTVTESEWFDSAIQTKMEGASLFNFAYNV